MTVSVIIPSHNRRENLAMTLRALSNLDPAPIEILVCLDGCTDDSAGLLRKEFPHVKVLVNRVAQGSIPSRDTLLRQATGDLVLSLDDDSYPIEGFFLAQATALFAADPLLAVLAFPQRSEEFPASLAKTDFGPDRDTGHYGSGAAILRRATYLKLPGYLPTFQHAYEEADYSLQCVAAGWRLRQHTGLTIRHHYSPLHRSELRTHHRHARNEQWSILLRCPAPWWPFVLLRRAAGQFRYACRRGPGWVIREPVWWWDAVKSWPAIWRHRNPVSWRAYKDWMHLLRHSPPLA